MVESSSRPMIRIHNAETNEIIDREMNDEEYAQYQTDQVEASARQAEAAAKEAQKAVAAAQKAALLARLGLTEDELKTILG